MHRPCAFGYTLVTLHTSQTHRESWESSSCHEDNVTSSSDCPSSSTAAEEATWDHHQGSGSSSLAAGEGGGGGQPTEPATSLRSVWPVSGSVSASVSVLLVLALLLLLLLLGLTLTLRHAWRHPASYPGQVLLKCRNAMAPPGTILGIKRQKKIIWDFSGFLKQLIPRCLGLANSPRILWVFFFFLCSFWSGPVLLSIGTCALAGGEGTRRHPGWAAPTQTCSGTKRCYTPTGLLKLTSVTNSALTACNGTCHYNAA